MKRRKRRAPPIWLVIGEWGAILERVLTMKVFVPRTKFTCSVAAVLLAAVVARGQMPRGMGPAMSQLFGDIKAFSAKAEVQVLDRSEREVARTPMDFALLNENIRIEADQAQASSRDMPRGMAESLRQMGLAHVISVIRPDKKLLYIIYPDHEAVLSQALPDDGPAPKAQRTDQGKETIDGHPCIKHKVVLTDAQGKRVEATTWNASDLKGFPVQIQTRDQDTTSVMRFRQVQLAKPEAKKFDVPAGYTQYASQQELSAAIDKKVHERTGKK